MIRSVPTTANPPATPAVPPPNPYFADLYAFNWSQLCLRTALISAIAIALCVFIGVFTGHPSAGLIAGGGAFTVAFGVNQRIADSRLWPMIAGTLAISVSTFIGMMVGHRGYALLLAAAVWSFAYGLLTTRNAGIAWVGQQSAVTLFVTSAFPAGPHNALLRALVLLAGSALQTLIVSISLQALPELKRNLILIPRAAASGAETILHRLYLREHLRDLPSALPGLSKTTGFNYAVRLAVTVLIAAELYRRLGIQSGYWIPMTALLVQKPAFFETLARAVLRIGGTLAGAVATTVFLSHVPCDPLVLAALATAFAFLALASNSVNYGLFSLFLTSYIVFLLSLNSVPGPVIAYRRGFCTAAGGLIALVIHLDGLRRHRAHLAAATISEIPAA